MIGETYGTGSRWSVHMKRAHRGDRELPRGPFPEIEQERYMREVAAGSWDAMLAAQRLLGEP